MAEHFKSKTTALKMTNDMSFVASVPNSGPANQKLSATSAVGAMGDSVPNNSPANQKPNGTHKVEAMGTNVAKRGTGA